LHFAYFESMGDLGVPLSEHRKAVERQRFSSGGVVRRVPPRFCFWLFSQLLEPFAYVFSPALIEGAAVFTVGTVESQKSKGDTN
jgi:hypothetical protein